MVPTPYSLHISVEVSEGVKGVDGVGERRLRAREILMLTRQRAPVPMM